jgi:hypothetical protein
MGFFTVSQLSLAVTLAHFRFAVFLTTIPSIFEGTYHQRPGIAGLNYCSLGIGLTVVSQINARAIDRVYAYLTNKNGGVGEPEFRLRD